jgi:Zn-dependent M28 family amino/carboxypeptidase
VVGAHYDTVPGSPGADDNASGVAALLELARLLRGCRRARTIRLVAFVNEEPPFFYWGEMGSTVYARAARSRGDDIRVMLSLEMLGCYSDVPGSQNYPPPLGLFYPNRATSSTSSRTCDRAARCAKPSAPLLATAPFPQNAWRRRPSCPALPGAINCRSGAQAIRR